MEINKNGHLSLNAVAYRQLDPDGGASDTLNQGRRGERYIESGQAGRARTVRSWLVEVEWLEHKNKYDRLNIIINY